MPTTLDVHRPLYPTAETVIDSDDEVDSVDERVTIGNHKPNKGGVDTWVNKPVHKKNNKSDDRKSKRWSFGIPPLTVNTSEKRHKQQPGRVVRTMSMSEASRPGLGEKPTHNLPKDSSKSNSNNHSLPTPAASPSSATPPIAIDLLAAAAKNKDSSGNIATSAGAAKFSSAAGGAGSSSKNISSSSISAGHVAAAVAALGTSPNSSSSPTSISTSTRPRSYSAYPAASNSSSSSLFSIGAGIKKPPTPVSPTEEVSHYQTMPALKKPHKAGQPVPLAPSSVVSASSDSSPSVSSGSTGSSLGDPRVDSRIAAYRKLSSIQTQNNGYFASVSDEVQSPMPEAPAPPSRGSAATSEDSSSEDMKPTLPSGSTSTPNISPSKNGSTRPPVHGRTYSNATVTGPEYDQEAAYAAYQQYPLHRKRSSFSSNDSRATAIPGAPPRGVPAGLGLDASVFEFLDEGAEDEAAAAVAPSHEDHEEEHDELLDSSPRSHDDATPSPEIQPKSPVKPASPKKTTPTSAAPPRSMPPHPTDSYFASQPPYGGYPGYPPMHYDPYMAPEGTPAEPAPQAPAQPMADPYMNMPPQAAENAMVHTPQKSNFKESIHARRAAAAAAAEAQAAEGPEIEEYHEEDYYPNYMAPPQGPPSYRGRPRMQPNQRAPQPPHPHAPPPQAHDMYGGYPPHPPPPQRAYTDSYPPYPRPQMPPQRNSMYGPGPGPQQQHMRAPPPPASSIGPYRTFGGSQLGSQVSTYNPNFGTMLQSNVSEMGTTVLGGRWGGQMNNGRPHPPSNLSNMTYGQAGYQDDYYGGYDGYYDQQGYHHEEPEYEEPQSIPSASPQYTKRRPMSGEFPGSKRNSIHGQWSAEWADTESNKGGSRLPNDRIPGGPAREEFELGKDGNDDQSWAKPAKTRRRNTITTNNKQPLFSSNFSDTSSAKLTSAASSRMQPLSEADIKSEASVEASIPAHGRHPPSINTSLPGKQKHGLPTPEDSPPAVKQCRVQSRPPTRHSSIASSFASKGAALTTIPVALGYPHLSSHLAESPNTAMYRRFDNLNHRILLHLQDEICELEQILENLDHQEQGIGNGGAGLRTRRGLNATGQRAPGPLDDNSARRLELMGAIFMKLQQYNNALAAYSKILNELPGASDESLGEYREWMSRHQPVVREEMDFVYKSNDFSTLIHDSSPQMRVHIPSGRSSRSSSFNGGQRPNLAVEGILGMLETIIAWVSKQETPIQLGVLAGIFFLLPIMLYLSVSTWFGIIMTTTACTAGFAYCAKNLLDAAPKKPALKPAADAKKNDTPPTNTTTPTVKA
ncbi:hypothetical protein H072_10648 [Dactylellina haptotyla CBS 200.50]|uniref:DUF6594 domain-containing protein n=1 Tax=Dactylellina haptotyla (strain CBS 200.50) TaxID=1284197 RepID=S8B9Z0_DACHA|nr:hypothetical protein H072_10648 [Dactylellina haptotyla CBS 200.50]